MILDTTGKVDASGFVVDFAGSEATVKLSAEREINLKLRAPRFEGSLNGMGPRSSSCSCSARFPNAFSSNREPAAGFRLPRGHLPESNAVHLHLLRR
jgi:hypothetical protein